MNTLLCEEGPTNCTNAGYFGNGLAMFFYQPQYFGWSNVMPDFLRLGENSVFAILSILYFLLSWVSSVILILKYIEVGMYIMFTDYNDQFNYTLSYFLSNF